MNAAAHKVFMQRTAGQFRGMRERWQKTIAKAANKAGLRSIPMSFPFELKDYRAWVLAQLQGCEEGAGRCQYCDKWIHAGSLIPDHYIPLDRGGSPALSNLAPSCESCNDLKGKLMPEAFQKLREFLDYQVGETDANEIRQRLKTAYQLAASLQRTRMFQRNRQGENTNGTGTGTVQRAQDDGSDAF